MLDPLIFNKFLHGVVLELGAVVGSNSLDLHTMSALSLLGEDHEFLESLILRLEKKDPSIP